MRGLKPVLFTLVLSVLSAGLIYYNVQFYLPHIQRVLRKPAAISGAQVKKVTAPEIKPEFQNLMAEIQPPAQEPQAKTKIPDLKKEMLRAPKFISTSTGENEDHATIEATWTKIKGAQRYQIKVFDEQNQEVKSYVTQGNKTIIRDLVVSPTQMSTKYKLQVTPIGKRGQMGPASPVKEVAMSPLRNIPPPSVKSVTTEEN